MKLLATYGNRMNPASFLPFSARAAPLSLSLSLPKERQRISTLLKWNGKYERYNGMEGEDWIFGTIYY